MRQHPNTASPTCIDLFAGAGGLAEGFRQAGWRVLAGTDADPFAAATFRANFPKAKFFHSAISKLRPRKIIASEASSDFELIGKLAARVMR